jgi:hypothetical protein
MSLTYPRVQAGEYQINDGHKTVGYIKKKNASKWIMYKCSNPAMLGKPIAVCKTLKELKVQAETLIGSTPCEINQNSPELDSLIKDMRDEQPDKFKIMREMMERNYVIDLTEYRQTQEGLEEIVSSYDTDLSTPVESISQL